MTAAVLALALACGPADDGGSEEPAGAFLARHWVRPVPAQGSPPDGWPPITTDLRPQACGACHAAQLRDWSTSLHAGAYSPGFEGQILPWLESDPAIVNSCMECHGPLTEQLALTHQPELERQGVLCAACHVRAWRRYGPPRRDGSVTPAPRATPHEGAIRLAEFEDGRFCAVCHQFEEPAANGKPLQNTVREWEASGYAERGVPCQTCHMPDRRHLWRGIHDPGMTRSGVTPELRLEGVPGDPGFRVRLGLANMGTGHHFPTYVTPAVDLELVFLDSAGDTLASSGRVLKRDVVFDGSRWIERADDRIPAGESRSLERIGAPPGGAVRVVGRVVVRPDAFYRDFFAGLLAETSGDPVARELLEEALDRTERSPYELWKGEAPLASGAR